MRRLLVIVAFAIANAATAVAFTTHFPSTPASAALLVPPGNTSVVYALAERFLKAHDVLLDYTIEDFEAESETSARLREKLLIVLLSSRA